MKQIINTGLFLIGMFLFICTGTVSAQQVEKGNKLPSGFPAYQRTGDVETDNANYEESKSRWVKENPVDYAEIINSQGVDNTLSVPLFSEYQIVDMADYTPVGVDGFPALNQGISSPQDYAEAKEKWIAENPEEYAKLSSPADTEENRKALEERKKIESELKGSQK